LAWPITLPDHVLRPVFNSQVVYPFKFTGVVSNQCKFPGYGMGGNQHIQRAYELPFALQTGTNRTITGGCLIIEGQDIYYGKKTA
jgi:hypothetical protein